MELTTADGSAAGGRWPRRDAVILTSARGLRAAGMGILSVLVAIYLGLTGMSAAQIGVVLTLSVVGGVALSIPATIAGDMLGRRRMVVALSLVTSLAGLILVFSDGLAWLAAGSFLGGYAATGMNVGPLLQLEQASLAEVAPGARRTAAFTYLGVVSSASRAVGALAAALPPVLTRLFGVEAVDAYRITFGVYTAVNFAATGLYLFLSPAVESRMQAAKRFLNPLKTGSRYRIFGFSFLLGVDSFAGGMIIDPLIAFWLSTKFGMSEGTIGPVIATANLLNMGSLWVAPVAARRFGLLNTMVWTQVVANALVVAFGLAPTGQLAVGVWLFRALFNEMDVPTRQSYAMAVVQDHERMAMAGVANIGRAAGRAASPAVTGLMWTGGALTVTPFVVAALIKFVHNGAMLAAFRGIRPPEERG